MLRKFLQRLWRGSGRLGPAETGELWELCGILLLLTLVKFDSLFIFSSCSSPSSDEGKGEDFGILKKGSQDNWANSKQIVFGKIFVSVSKFYLEIWVKSLVGSSWALKFLRIFYPSGIFSSGFALCPLCWCWDFSFLPALCWQSLLQRAWISFQAGFPQNKNPFTGKALTSFPAPLFLPKLNFPE